jgi:hypothetical protein
MRSVVVLVTAVVVASAAVAPGSPASGSPGASPPRVVGWWHFDEGSGPAARDASDAGNTATLQGVRWTAGHAGSAIAIDGRAASVADVAPTPDLEPRLVTLDLRVHAARAPGADASIVTKGMADCIGSYSLRTDDDGALRFMVSNGAATARSATPSVAPWDGEWHDVAGTWDGTVARLFIDGVEATAGSASGTLHGPIGYGGGSPGDLLFGFDPTCRGGAFVGAVDEAKIWDGPLSPDAIAAQAGRVHPVAAPVSPTTCEDQGPAVPWPVDEQVIIPMGADCPYGGGWLTWDGSWDLPGWIAVPAGPDLSTPRWQDGARGQPAETLAEAAAALNAWRGKVIELPGFDTSRGGDADLQYHVVGTTPFVLEHAYLVGDAAACAPAGASSCIVGRFIGQTPRSTIRRPPPPSPSPSRSPSPAPDPTDSPEPSHTPGPTRTTEPSRTPGPSHTPEPSRTPGPSGSPEPSRTPEPTRTPELTHSPRPSETPEPTHTPGPTSTPPPRPFLALTVPNDVAIHLDRGRLNSVVVPVRVSSNVAWALTVAARDTGPTRGHMVSVGAAHPLAAVMTAGVRRRPPVPLDRPTFGMVTAGYRDAIVPVELEQPVTAVDRPGRYSITIVFAAISGF